MTPTFDDLVTSYTLTCEACPTQYEGDLADGRRFYFRYRFARAMLGIGATDHDAVKETLTGPFVHYGDPPYQGEIDEAEFKDLFMRLMREREDP